MHWASCKDYAGSTSNESDLPECIASGMGFNWGNLIFLANNKYCWCQQIKEFQNNQHMGKKG